MIKTRPLSSLGRAVGVPESYAKRLTDILGATTGLVFLAPFLFVIALLIKADSPGPAIFRQKRIGKNGREFVFYKFRSMRDGNDSSIHRNYVKKLIQGDHGDIKGEEGSFKIERDPRVTKLGRLLRRSSIDELPQLLNVLRGDMSLVGPRPPLQYEVEMYKPQHLRRLEVLPGITGLWQVSGRTKKNFDEMVELDLKYIDNRSLWLDIKILFRTISAVLSRKGAW